MYSRELLGLLRPSVSRMISSVSSLREIGRFHIQIPVVQGSFVWPIENPCDLKES